MDHPIGISLAWWIKEALQVVVTEDNEMDPSLIEHELSGWDDVEEGDKEDLVYVGVRPTSSVPVIRLREGFI